LSAPALSPATRAAIEGWTRAPAPLLLTGGVQNYAWGQRNAAAIIPRLLGVAAESDRPYAELWLGAHPVLPATVTVNGVVVNLIDLIAAAPAFVLGQTCLETFGPQLPFLMKVLAAAHPLSIQAHPNRAQAEAGFAREEATGIPLQAAHRMYRDRNHKPELIVALDEFVALKGFRPVEDIQATFARAPELAPLLRAPAPPTSDGVDARSAWLRALFTHLLSPAAVEVDVALAAWLRRLEVEDRAQSLSDGQPAYWVRRAAQTLGAATAATAAPDRGLLAFCLLNLVHLRPGQALFLGPGDLHAYLEGSGIEVMANSDNVLRGGLTPKPIDVEALIATLTFDAGTPQILNAAADGHYNTPAKEFVTARLALPSGGVVTLTGARGADIVLLLEGHGQLADTLARAGQAFLIPAGLGSYRLTAGDTGLLAFRTTTAPPHDWSLLPR
jgi:mannose-6-phosphate isomerase